MGIRDAQSSFTHSWVKIIPVGFHHAEECERDSVGFWATVGFFHLPSRLLWEHFALKQSSVGLWATCGLEGFPLRADSKETVGLPHVERTILRRQTPQNQSCARSSVEIFNPETRYHSFQSILTNPIPYH